MIRLGAFFDRANGELRARPWLAYGFLAVLYLLLQAPRLFVIRYFDELVFSLDSIVIGQKLIFHGLHLRTMLGNTLITPVNPAFIYPPAIYMISALLGSVKGLFLFSLLVQLCVPLLLYKLMLRFVPAMTALLTAAVGTYHFVNAAWWAPDFLIQPIMISALLLSGIGKDDGRPGMAKLSAVGALAGLIMILKHNIGVFFAILMGSWIFLSSFHPGQGTRAGKAAAFLLLSGYFLFGAYFAVRLSHMDEIIYFLAPYLLFWSLFAIYLWRSPIIFSAATFARMAAFFSATALMLPAAIFVYFADTIGTTRYIHSLFGTTMEHLTLWDRGLFNVITNGTSFSSISRAYRSLLMVLLYFLPCIVGFYVVFETAIQTRRNAADSDTLQIFRLAMLPVMAVFLLFPLEAPHILITKIFIFLAIGIYFAFRFRPSVSQAATFALGLALVPVVGYGFWHFSVQLQTPSTVGSAEIQRAVGLPVETGLAHELDRQLAVVKVTAHNKPFYVVDSGDGTLWSLTALANVDRPQYYVVMLQGLLNPQIAEAVKNEMASYEFVLVNKLEYERFQQGRGKDEYLDSVYAYVARNFTRVGAYDAPENRSALMLSVLSFYMMRRNAAN